MKHLGLHAFNVHLIHMQAPVLPAKYCEMPCKGFLLSNVTSAHNALRPRAPLCHLLTSYQQRPAGIYCLASSHKKG